MTDNRELLEEALEENDSVRMTALEAVGDDDPSLGAAIRMLRELRDDWRALVARAEAENAGLSRMDDYARIVTGVEQLADGMVLPADLAAFAAEVRSRDAEIVERRQRELAFVQKADMHCRKQPLFKWAAEERGRPLSELPEHAEWLADGAALAETGRRMGEGLVGWIAAALGRIVRSFRLDEAERFREAAVRHEAEAQSRCIRAAWSDAGLRELELARQRSVPSEVCRLACPEPVEGDRIAWTEAAGLKGGIRTIEAVVATRTGTPNGRNLELRVTAASGPGAPEPGSAIERTADAVTARGCFRAPWADEARRERILHPPEQRTEEQTREQGRDRSRDRGFSM